MFPPMKRQRTDCSRDCSGVTMDSKQTVFDKLFSIDITDYQRVPDEICRARV